ncbi:hypothetical protein CH063_01942 [Colletotrichum higginsianum]|uniref:Uncharacterized protein n=1 Tax=Colletotrichum higginsianum (strain IMI 349063) TaxID=759273 RepID=H1VED6_COLHI|nr:hypothetical protein CH063_01942 [Colletotrichum higginsianum]
MKIQRETYGKQQQVKHRGASGCSLNIPSYASPLMERSAYPPRAGWGIMGRGPLLLEG